MPSVQVSELPDELERIKVTVSLDDKHYDSAYVNRKDIPEKEVFDQILKEGYQNSISIGSGFILKKALYYDGRTETSGVRYIVNFGTDDLYLDDFMGQALMKQLLNLRELKTAEFCDEYVQCRKSKHYYDVDTQEPAKKLPEQYRFTDPVTLIASDNIETFYDCVREVERMPKSYFN